MNINIRVIITLLQKHLIIFIKLYISDFCYIIINNFFLIIIIYSLNCFNTVFLQY